MRRFMIGALAVALLLSLAANGLLGLAAYRAQKEYRALATQFVKVKADLTRARAAQTTAPAAGPPVQAAPSAVAAAAQAAQPPAPPVEQARTAPTTTTAAVQAAYEPRLLAVQAECEEQLNTLVDQAKAEYKQAKATGGKTDLAAFAARFYPKADGLRRECDRKVEALLSQMGRDLRANQLPSDLVDEVRGAYQERIVERQAEIMAKIGQ
jgi:hypothetical protein